MMSQIESKSIAITMIHAESNFRDPLVTPIGGRSAARDGRLLLAGVAVTLRFRVPVEAVLVEVVSVEVVIA